jgi:hypothetical protein
MHVQAKHNEWPKKKNLTLTQACEDKTQWMLRKVKFNPNTCMCEQNTMNDQKGKKLTLTHVCAGKTQWMTRMGKFNPNASIKNEWQKIKI